MLLLYLSLSLVSGADVGSCDVYVCENDKHPLTGEDCTFVDYSKLPPVHYTSQTGCASGKECIESSESGSLYTCQTPKNILKTLFPGEKLEAGAICGYGPKKASSSNICEGFALNVTCSSSKDCNPGLRCSADKKCENQLPLNTFNCTDDYDCDNNAGCYRNETHSFCKEYFSIKENTEIGNLNCNDIYSHNLLCSNGHCGANNEGKYVCLGEVKSDKSMPVKCDTAEASIDCKSKESPILFSRCECGYNSHGYAYCHPFYGDSMGKKLIDKLKKWYKSSGVLNCNTEARFRSTCIKDWWKEDDYYEIMYLFYRMRDYPLTVDLNDCVLNTVRQLQEYRVASENYNDFADIKHVALALLLLLNF